jgi:hypothetical protein
MPSIREQILAAFFTELKTIETDSVKVLRNPDKSIRVPDGGAVIILRDGESGEPEVMLSPLTYIYEHQASLEVMINNAFAARQEISLDDLLMIIGNLIQNNRGMNGLAEWSEPSAPDFQQDAVDGTPAMRAAMLTVLFRFSTFNPLS